jgi:hypothetical protein
MTMASALPFFQLAASAGTCIGLFFAFYGFLHNRKTHTYKILLDLHHELQTDQLQDALRFIFKRAKEAEGTAIKLPLYDADEVKQVERVLNAYDLIALRCLQDVICVEDFLMSEWRVVLPLWRYTQPFIELQRKLRELPITLQNPGVEDYYGTYKGPLEWLGKRAKKFQRDHKWAEPATFDPVKLLTPKPERADSAGLTIPQSPNSSSSGPVDK